MPISTPDLFVVMLALAAALGAWAVTQIVWGLVRPERNEIHRRLGLAEATELDMPNVAAFLRESRQQHRAWESIPVLGPIALRLETTMPGVTPGVFFGGAALAAAAAGGLAFAAGLSPVIVIVAALLVGAAPLAYASAVWARRQKLLTEQLIESLDFLARSLRAGHSLPNGLQMIAQEIPDPIATEFRKVYEQHNHGQSLEAGLTAMAGRLQLTEFSFFVTSVLIQRQTGGDLAEVLDNINNMVRGRIRLAQHVRALTAEGRATGWLLLALPIVTMLAISAANPSYARVMTEHPTGRMMLGGAVVLQTLGFLMIRKIVNIQA
jgi:tight adherence protein B